MAHDDSDSKEIQDDDKTIIRKRQRQVKVYLSEAEYSRFQELQKETSLSAAALIRRWITGQQISSTLDIQAINEMRRQGGLFKHCAWNLGNHNVISESAVEELIELAMSIHSIAKEIRNDFKENTKDR